MSMLDMGRRIGIDGSHFRAHFSKGISNEPTPQTFSSPFHADNSGTPARLLRTQGDSVGYYEQIPRHVRRAWVVEEGSDGKDILTQVTPEPKSHIIDVFDAASNPKRVISVVLEGPMMGGLPTVQTIFNNAEFNSGHGSADMVFPGGRRITRGSSAYDVTTHLPAGYLTGTRVK